MEEFFKANRDKSGYLELLNAKLSHGRCENFFDSSTIHRVGCINNQFIVYRTYGSPASFLLSIKRITTVLLAEMLLSWWAGFVESTRLAARLGPPLTTNR